MTTQNEPAQQTVAADGRLSSPPEASCLSPVVKYHGLGFIDWYCRDFWMRPQLNSDTLGGRRANVLGNEWAFERAVTQTRFSIAWAVTLFEIAASSMSEASVLKLKRWLFRPGRFWRAVFRAGGLVLGAGRSRASLCW